MSETVRVKAPVSGAVVFEDRAEVRRSTAVRVDGSATVVFEDVTALVDDAQVTAHFEGDARVDGVRVERRWIAASEDPDRRRAREAALEAAEAALEAAERALRVAEQRHESALTTLERVVTQAGRAVWGGSLDGIDATLEATEALVAAASAETDRRREACAEARRTHRRAAEQIRDHQRRRDQRLRCDVEVRLSAEGAGEGQLTLKAVVPCAVWRPAHEAHLLADGTVRWTTHGTVWQRTGEPWTQVKLSLSTDRPGAGAELPGLSEDRLAPRVKADKKKVHLSHREEAVAQDAGDDAVPGVYDGGEPRAFRAEGPVDVPADGLPRRVPTGGFESEAELRRVARPEVAEQVFLLAELRNASAQPLLAGPVTLLRGGAFVGLGEIAYVGPGERFELSFGSDDRWRVRHRRERKLETRRLGRDRTHFVNVVELDYSGEASEPVEVVLRLPVSELEALKIVPSKEHCSEGPPEPDADGRVRVPVSLSGGERREVTLGFWLDKSDDVVLPDPW